MRDASPTARALVTLELLQASPTLKAEALADRLGVTERAARRYIAILREAGIPIDSVRGPYGGYRIGRGVRLPPLMFSAAEALAVVMAVLDGHHDTSDPGNDVGNALAKVLRALPESVAAQAEAVRRTAAAAPDRTAVRPDPSTTAALVQASSSLHCVQLDYRTESGSEWTAEVEPWAVVVRHGRWYLLGRSTATGEQRAYRIDRVRSVETLDARFTPPAGLDAVATLEEHLAVGWAYDTEVVIDAPVEAVARWVPRRLGRLEPVDAATTRLVGSTNDPTSYAEQLAAIAAPFRITRGDELRDALRMIGRRLVDAGAAT